MQAKHFIKEITKHVDRYDWLFIEKTKTVGEATGWIVKPGKAEVVFTAAEEETGMGWYRKFWDELNFNSNVFIWKQFMIYPAYNGKNRGYYAQKVVNDYMIEKGCKGMMAYPLPIQVSDDKKEQLRTRNMPKIDLDEIEKGRNFLIDFYIENYVDAGGYKRYKDTELIIKEMP